MKNKKKVIEKLRPQKRIHYYLDGYSSYHNLTNVKYDWRIFNIQLFRERQKKMGHSPFSHMYQPISRLPPQRMWGSQSVSYYLRPLQFDPRTNMQSDKHKVSIYVTPHNVCSPFWTPCMISKSPRGPKILNGRYT